MLFSDVWSENTPLFKRFENSIYYTMALTYMYVVNNSVTKKNI